VTELDFDRFSLRLPPGWSDVLDDMTYTNPDQTPPIAFAADSGPGTMYISHVLFRVDEQPGARATDAEQLVSQWASRRNLVSLASGMDSSPRGGMATATFKLSRDFIQIWYITNSESVLHASYVCDWEDQHVETEARGSIVSSLQFR